MPMGIGYPDGSKKNKNVRIVFLNRGYRAGKTSDTEKIKKKMKRDALKRKMNITFI